MLTLQPLSKNWNREIKIDSNMNAVFTILTILVILASIFITLVVLLQNSKGGGLASNFAAGNQTFGVRQTADLLEKVTWGLVSFIFVVTIVTSFVTGTGNGSGSDITDKIEQNIQESRPQFPPVQSQENPAQEVPAQENPAQEAAQE